MDSNVRFSQAIKKQKGFRHSWRGRLRGFVPDFVPSRATHSPDQPGWNATPD
jgi:hypothetical protein